MPWTEHDYDVDHAELDYHLGPHDHHVGSRQPDEHVQLDHGKRADRIYARRGDWYAVHTH